jgi:hypothetical protein
VQVEILVAVGSQGGLVHRRAVGHHHQDLANLAPAAQAAVRPLHRLAVDVLLEHVVAHEESQRRTRAAPGNVGRLHYHVFERVQPAGRIRVAVGRPLPRRLASVPLTRREAEHLALDTASFEHLGEDFDRQRGDEHGTAAHRAGVIDQQADDRARKGRVAFLLERTCAPSARHQCVAPEAVQLALVEIEPPLSRLARHQHPHQPLGQSRHHDAQRGQVLLEHLAECLQFLAARERRCAHHAVVPYRVGLVAVGASAAFCPLTAAGLGTGALGLSIPAAVGWALAAAHPALYDSRRQGHAMRTWCRGLRRCHGSVGLERPACGRLGKGGMVGPPAAERRERRQ